MRTSRPRTARVARVFSTTITLRGGRSALRKTAHQEVCAERRQRTDADRARRLAVETAGAIEHRAQRRDHAADLFEDHRADGRELHDVAGSHEERR
jgi:hypothetical protein